jgi:cyclic-di-AMP phosphodiesterase
MRLKMEKIKKIIYSLLIIQASALFIICYLKSEVNVLAILILIAEAIISLTVLSDFDEAYKSGYAEVREELGDTSVEAMRAGGVGIVMYDDDYVVTWMSDLFKERSIEHVGDRVLGWIPEADDLIAGKSDSVTITLDDKTYRVSRREDAQVLIFTDVTKLVTLQQKYNDQLLVLGLASFDNYDESVQFEGEADATNISATVRAPLVEYFNMHHVLMKRLNNSKYLLILNEKAFQSMVNDHFSILSKIRKVSMKMDVSITLSMAFAMGSSEYDVLDEMTANLMDLAQTRGGDQVAVQAVGKDVKFYGGSSEANERRSRVRVRVMSHALRDVILKSSNVIICGHKIADFDCIGSALGLSRMVTALGKPVSIIAKTGGIEEKLSGALKMNMDELKEEFNFITDSEAMNQLQDKTLVIMTDHHTIKQSNGAKVLEQAKKIVVIDHHRRATEMGVKPMLVYIEAGASSACELVTEMIPYISNKTDISDTVASLMLTGMVVDTQRWRVRTGARTYEAAATLKEMGADVSKSNAWLKDTFDEFAIKTEVATSAERYDHGVVIASVENKVLSRSLISQVADSLLDLQGVRAAFVISNSSENETGISARSDGTINVQMIMESMGGGGHMTAAAIQKTKVKVADMKKDLLDAIDQYFMEESDDESNS